MGGGRYDVRALGSLDLLHYKKPYRTVLSRTPRTSMIWLGYLLVLLAAPASAFAVLWLTFTLRDYVEKKRLTAEDGERTALMPRISLLLYKYRFWFMIALALFISAAAKV